MYISPIKKIRDFYQPVILLFGGGGGVLCFQSTKGHVAMPLSKPGPVETGLPKKKTKQGRDLYPPGD